MTRPARILLVDDNQGDVRLIQEGFLLIKLQNELLIAASLDETMAILPRIDLILLDVRYPDEVEDFYDRSGELLKDKKVVLMTESDVSVTLLKNLGIKAHGYITKPVDIIQLASIMNQVSGIRLCLILE